MITCPSCNHQNPEGSLQCENCYTPLPATVSCPNCGASVQTDATFCGQCGFNLQAENPSIAVPLEETAIGSLPDISLEEISLPEEISLADSPPLESLEDDNVNSTDILPETSMSSPIQSPWDEEFSQEDLTTGQTTPIVDSKGTLETTEVMGDQNLTAEEEERLTLDSLSLDPSQATPPEQVEIGIPDLTSDPETTEVDLELAALDNAASGNVVEDMATPELETAKAAPEVQVFEPKPNFAASAASAANTVSGATQLQLETASLLHLQTDTTIKLPLDLNLVHLGKPNGQIPPDIDVAGFPDSEVVSRVHADIRIEGDAYYVEDTGSSNGTYVNHTPLVRGNRHRLRSGDRIALGKGDLVTFIFQIN